MGQLGARRSPAPVVVAAVVVLLLLAAGLTAALVLRGSGDDAARDPVPTAAPPPGEPVPWTAFAVAGAHVQVSYDGSACQESSAAVATETDERVVVTAYAKVKPGVCILSAVRYDVSVDLDAPLGDRPLYDGACLEQRRAGGAGLDPACLRTPPA